MSKWYRVKVERWIDCLVEVADGQGEEQALSVAMEEHVSGEIGDGEAKGAVEIPASALAAEKRHADSVLPL